jgi:hypothetical protein
MLCGDIDPHGASAVNVTWYRILILDTMLGKRTDWWVATATS